jgi:drug/metabolite transporter (DMT)-like permease
MDVGWLWIPATLIACAGQVARNTMQRGLTEELGTVGATQVRFVYGLPFALLFLAVLLPVTGEALPRPGPGFTGFLLLGAVSQILATALMLAAMRLRSFSVVTAVLKAEVIQIAVFGFVVLGDRLSVAAVLAVVTATAGVVAVSWTPRTVGDMAQGGGRAIALGLLAGALFAFAAVGFRGAILAFETGSFLARSAAVLAWGLAIQTALLGAWLAAFNRAALLGGLRHWRRSLTAGCLGAGTSLFWFIGFALTAAANVRTLGLVEVVLAQFVSRRVLREGTAPRELAGMALIGLGVLLLLTSAG